MALPAGITTVPVTFSPPATWTGQDAVLSVTITPTHSLVHVPTGTPLGAFSEDFTATAGTTLTVSLPHTNQPNLIDGTGGAFTNWGYTARGRWSYKGQIVSFQKAFQLPMGTTGPVDLDLLPTATMIPAVSAPTPVVTSLGGRTGAISMATLATDLDPFLVDPAPAGTQMVFVTTGSETRPTAPSVIWVGGMVQPTHMTSADLWFAPPGALTDTTPPTAPTNLASSVITANSFTLNWTASTDNSGVTAYDVYLDGSFNGTVSTNTANITGLISSHAYTVTIKARDAAGNVSDASAALIVTTTAPTGSPRHSIWGSSAYPFTLTKGTGTPTTYANRFYSYGSSPDVSLWRVRGAKIWIPAGVTMTGSVTLKAWAGVAMQNAPQSQGTITTLVAGQWNEIIFPTIIETSSGDWIDVGYRFDSGDYLSASLVGQGVDGFITALDGSHIVLAGATEARSQIMVDASAPQATSNMAYGIDIIYDEGPI